MISKGRRRREIEDARGLEEVVLEAAALRIEAVEAVHSSDSTILIRRAAVLEGA